MPFPVILFMCLLCVLGWRHPGLQLPCGYTGSLHPQPGSGERVQETRHRYCYLGGLCAVRQPCRVHALQRENGADTHFVCYVPYESDVEVVLLSQK